jgi:serine/threonine protein kinase
LREPGKGLAKLVLYFRDAGWTRARPERLAERDEWIAALNSQRENLGLPALQVVTRQAAPVSEMATMPGKPDGELIGKVLGGKYEILKHIGSGGMGLIYEGKDTSLDRLVAVKRMRPEVAMSGRDKTLFLKEAKTSAALHHPFIVDIYSILDEGPEIFLVFEYVDGKTLQERLDEKGPFDAKELRPLLKCICEALAYAHSERYAHRDLKPSNIMINKQGYAKVMDFGIARAFKDTASRTSRLDTSGTMPYMAPEQELGKGDMRCDIFALGATVYELLSGELPFRGPNFYLQKEKKDYRRLLEVAPDTPGEIAAAVERCLEFDPNQRFQTIGDFAKSVGVA